jgi:hypothetical protein
VRVEEEDGQPLTESLVVVERGSLPRGSDFPISSLIEAAPYCDTIWNPVQTKSFYRRVNILGT